MTIAKRPHLFPSRTQKLSSLAPMILGGKLPGKVGRCRFFYAHSLSYALFLFFEKYVIFLCDEVLVYLCVFYVYLFKPIDLYSLSCYNHKNKPKKEAAEMMNKKFYFYFYFAKGCPVYG